MFLLKIKFVKAEFKTRFINPGACAYMFLSPILKCCYTHGPLHYPDNRAMTNIPIFTHFKTYILSWGLLHPCDPTVTESLRPGYSEVHKI
jgi:hypothetical protein